jgi:plastocyanin
MKRRLVLLSVGLLLVAFGGACGGDDDDDGGGDQTTSGTTGDSDGDDGPVITIENLTFSGADSTEVGTPVTVDNEDSTEHTFTPDNAGDFEPATLEGGASASIDFAEAGTFSYHCEIHSTMKGTIEVTE